MKTIFLGPWLHWLILAGLIAAGWLSGTERLHVSQFNPFLVVLILIVIAVIVIVLKSSPPGRRVTRDPVEEADGDQSG
ncbi:MAG: hypothetical protein AAGJ28_06790 [Pseudomonadota bacterium]